MARRKIEWDPKVRFMPEVSDELESCGYSTIVTYSPTNKQKRTCWAVRCGDNIGYVIVDAETTANIAYWSPGCSPKLSRQASC